MDALPIRLASGLLVLIACTIALSRGIDRTPSHMVTELVSVVNVPARAVVPRPPAVPEVVEENVQAVPAPPQIQEAPRIVRVAARPARVHPPKPQPRRDTPPLAKGKQQPAVQRVAVREEPKDPLPVVFRPIRNAGLFLQKRLAHRNANADAGAAP